MVLKRAIFLESHYENVDEHETELVRVLWNPTDKKFIKWKDRKRFHYPFCLTTDPVYLTREMRPNYVDTVKVKRHHPMKDREMDLYKVMFKNPMAVKDVKDEWDGAKINNIYENTIKYESRWCIDTHNEFGIIYNYEDDGSGTTYNVFHEPSKEGEFADYKDKLDSISNFSKDMEDELFDLLMHDFIFPSAFGVDIEVLMTGRVIPNAEYSPNPITSVSIVFSDQPSYVLALDSSVRMIERGKDLEFMKRVFNKEVIVIWFEEEIALLEKFIDIILNSKHAVMLTFNGDRFDIPYLYNRMKVLGVMNNPFRRKVLNYKNHEYYWVIEPYLIKDNNLMKDGAGKPIRDMNHYVIHVDLYQFFKMPYIQVYAFKNKYKKHGLDDIAEALLGVGKVEYDGLLDELKLWKLVKYNWWDSYLLIELWRFNENIVPSLMLIFMRLGFQGMQLNGRKQISSKLDNLFLWRCQRRGWVKPNKDEIPKTSSTIESKIAGKKFQGAEVIEPVVGVYFDVVCKDFTGLYTNIMYKKNISTETVNCNHRECFNNIVPEVGHHICTKNIGIASEIIGFITTVRSIVFKPLKKQPKFGSIEQALKVLGNAAYGVISAPFFSWFAIAAGESITAFGRNAIKSLKAEAERLGMLVVRGDTDSVFVVNFTEKTLKQLEDFAWNVLGLGLETDYDGRLIINSKRKKNYIIVLKDGSFLLKGLKLKKRNTPQIIKHIGNEIIKIVLTIQTPDDLEPAKEQIKTIINKGLWMVRKREGNIEDYYYYTEIKKAVDKYKVRTQHVVAANIEADIILKNEKDGFMFSRADVIPVGKIQDYIKSNTEYGVLPPVLAEKKYINVGKYLEDIQSSINPLIEMLDIDIDFRIKPRRKLVDFIN